ncbi:MAG: sensor histidine kinase, partial [Candidatus Hodarchaeota archaeon]
ILFSIETPKEPCYIKGDLLIDDLFLNLFSNALKFNKKPKKNVTVSVNKNSEGYNVFIDDEGIGIPDSRKDTLFEHGDTPSTELGLIIVKRLVDKYRGRISVMNRIPEDYTKGTRFAVFFPYPGKERVQVLDFSRLKST